MKRKEKIIFNANNESDVRELFNLLDIVSKDIISIKNGDKNFGFAIADKIHWCPKDVFNFLIYGKYEIIRPVDEYKKALITIKDTLEKEATSDQLLLIDTLHFVNNVLENKIIEGE